MHDSLEEVNIADVVSLDYIVQYDGVVDRTNILKYNIFRKGEVVNTGKASKLKVPVKLFF